MICRWYAFSLEAMRRSSRSQFTLEGVPRRLPPRTGRLGLLAVAQDLEAHELVDVTCRQGGLVELDSELLHPNRGDVDHKEREFY